ncbi:MAG: hypothetical protein FWC69_02605 [Defluviitaleaceae bacterium]|nr:hypothetical protein [Defluviitaleaceae bacterium]
MDLSKKFYFEDDFHPDFLEHFIADFYYDESDEEAPFGSDEGADTLYELEEHFKATGETSLDHEAFLEELFADWELNYIKPKETPFEELEELLKDDEIKISIHQSLVATFACAFGQIKITGALNPALKDIALLALKQFDVFMALEDYEESPTIQKMIGDLSEWKY